MSARIARSAAGSFSVVVSCPKIFQAAMIRSLEKRAPGTSAGAVCAAPPDQQRDGGGRARPVLERRECWGKCRGSGPARGGGRHQEEGYRGVESGLRGTPTSPLPPPRPPPPRTSTS